jgi:hypothetical protein
MLTPPPCKYTVTAALWPATDGTQARYGVNVITLTSDYARLSIGEDEPFDQVAESMRMLFQLCRLNTLHGLVVSKQAALDWRSSMRVALRFIAIRGSAPAMRLAFVAKAGEEVRKRGLHRSRDGRLAVRCIS